MVAECLGSAAGVLSVFPSQLVHVGVRVLYWPVVEAISNMLNSASFNIGYGIWG